MPRPDHYQLTCNAHQRLIEARDSLRLLDGYVNKTDILCNPSMLAGYVSLLQTALRDVLRGTRPVDHNATADALNGLSEPERQLIRQMRRISEEGRKDLMAMADRMYQGKPMVG